MYRYSNTLFHYGILGMRWGLRRYQNEDGTLTDAGKARRRAIDMTDEELRNANNRLKLEDEYNRRLHPIRSKIKDRILGNGQSRKKGLISRGAERFAEGVVNKTADRLSDAIVKPKEKPPKIPRNVSDLDRLSASDLQNINRWISARNSAITNVNQENAARRERENTVRQEREQARANRERERYERQVQRGEGAVQEWLRRAEESSNSNNPDISEWEREAERHRRAAERANSL